jgi:hypothetical protein
MQKRIQIVTNANTQIINEMVLMIFITPHHHHILNGLYSSTNYNNKQSSSLTGPLTTGTEQIG